MAANLIGALFLFAALRAAFMTDIELGHTAKRVLVRMAFVVKFLHPFKIYSVTGTEFFLFIFLSMMTGKNFKISDLYILTPSTTLEIVPETEGLSGSSPSERDL